MVRAKTKSKYVEPESESEDDNRRVNTSKSGKIVWKEDSEEEFTDAGEVEDGNDSDFEEQSAKKRKIGRPSSTKKTPTKSPKKGGKKKRGRPSSTKKTPTPAKKKGSAKKAGRPSGGSRKSKAPVKYADTSEEESAQEESEEEVSEDEVRPNWQTNAGRPKKAKFPPLSEMVPTAIKRLRDNPRKGSSLAAIKGFMAEEYGINIQSFAPKIKKYILKAVEDGEIKQTKGKGASGRFTVPGLKAKKKPKKNRLPKWEDEPEEEYKPTKTAREEDKEKHEREMEMARVQRMEENARKREEKENRPKKPRPPKKTDFAVECIKNMKVRQDKSWYLVKWEGNIKPTWEPEEHLDGCQEAIDNFLFEEKQRLREDEARKRREEEEGKFEVHRILEVKFPKSGGREFLIRWKGHGEEDDSWEPEANLDCTEAIERFMKKFEQRLEVSEKRLREAPKVVERLAFANSKRQGKRNQGFRVTYEDMDE